MQDEIRSPDRRSPEPDGCTLLDRLGGETALNSLIGAFYFNVLAHASLATFFADKDVSRLLSHQRAFFTAILGGEDRYRGRDLREAHRDLVERSGLNGGHIDSLVEVLSFTLDRLGHDAELRCELVRRVMLLRDQVLGAKSGAG